MKKNFWYYRKNSKTCGPHSYSEMRNFILRGEISPANLVYCDSEGQWRPALSWQVFDRSLFPASLFNWSPLPNNSEHPRREVNFKQSSWYYWSNEQVVGPQSYQEVEAAISRGDIGPRNLLFNDSVGSWQPAISWKAFAPELFASAKMIFNNCKESVSEERAWVVLSQPQEGKVQLQEGPFTTEELSEKIKKRKITLQQYAWRPGMTSWCQLKDIPV